MLLTSTEAGKIAIEFIMLEWSIPDEYQDWFSVINSRLLGVSWYVVEVGIDGLPDRWYIQVYDTGDCDPNYTFDSPIPSEEKLSDLQELPEFIAEVLISERNVR
ncbi:MAG: hypothetical protein ACFB02_08280 [Mastigocoleus sp.]